MAGNGVTNRICHLRFEAGRMTRQQLADKVRVARQTIIAIESGKSSPSLLLAFRIAAVFGLGVENVFGYQPESRAFRAVHRRLLGSTAQRANRPLQTGHAPRS